jgi:hypothetical protein
VSEVAIDEIGAWQATTTRPTARAAIAPVLLKIDCNTEIPPSMEAAGQAGRTAKPRIRTEKRGEFGIEFGQPGRDPGS